MSARVQKPRTRAKKDTRTDQDQDQRPRPQVKREAVQRELDEFLDEVDSVLEENAEVFVKGYVQKGGE
jgi:ubiquitin-like protein Pup